MVFGAEQGQVGLHKQHRQRRQARPATTEPSCLPSPASHPTPPHHPHLLPLPPRLASHVLLRPSFPSALTSPVPSARPARRRFVHLGACPPRVSLSLVFVLIRNDSPAYFGDEIPRAAPRLVLDLNSDVVGCPQEMKTHHVGPLQTRDGQREGGVGL